MHTIIYVLAAIAVVGAIVSTISAMPLMQAQENNTGNQTEVPVITLTGNETGPIALNETTEPEPIPEPQTNETVVTEEPQVLTEPGTEGPFNITAIQEPDEATITVTLASLNAGNNVTVIEPDGNVTVIPDVNVTVVDNNTVVIAPPTENVTTIPDNNVTIITPAPEPCGCPAANETAEEPLVPVIVRPAPGQQVTIEGGEVTVQNETGVVVQGTDNATITDPQPEPEPVPSENATDTGGNDTGLAPVSFDYSWMNPTNV